VNAGTSERILLLSGTLKSVLLALYHVQLKLSSASGGSIRSSAPPSAVVLQPTSGNSTGAAALGVALAAAAAAGTTLAHSISDTGGSHDAGAHSGLIHHHDLALHEDDAAEHSDHDEHYADAEESEVEDEAGLSIDALTCHLESGASLGSGSMSGHINAVLPDAAFVAAGVTEAARRAQTQLRLVMPAGVCGVLIGRGGATIRTVSQGTSTSISVSPQERDRGSEYDRWVKGALVPQQRAMGCSLPCTCMEGAGSRAPFFACVVYHRRGRPSRSPPNG
jgi:hypothetical protein